MTARIDHEDQANQAAAAGKYDIAQYHATMFRAQQAKVANLIAMFALPEADAHDFARTGFSYAEAAIDIRDGLGLS